jgi:hypothetical protein
MYERFVPKGTCAVAESSSRCGSSQEQTSIQLTPIPIGSSSILLFDCTLISAIGSLYNTIGCCGRRLCILTAKIQY